jgi:hypothetical protein
MLAGGRAEVKRRAGAGVEVQDAKLAKESIDVRARISGSHIFHFPFFIEEEVTQCAFSRQMTNITSKGTRDELQQTIAMANNE